ncbi:MAG TPA: hypothetical protein VEA58_08760, partial [Anaerovoracaceae bacterium]|nr:hypothetical protein [Anaerovoracaceae bacterium]
MREFVKAWVISCFLFLVSSVSYTLLLLPAATPLSLSSFALNILSLYTIVFIFSACCSVDNIPYKKFWTQYPLLLLTYGLVLSILNIHVSVIALPFFAYELILTAATVFTIIRRWRLDIRLRVLFSVFFAVCSLYQIYSNFLLLVSEINPVMIGTNVLLLILLNFAFA